MYSLVSPKNAVGGEGKNKGKSIIFPISHWPGEIDIGSAIADPEFRNSTNIVYGSASSRFCVHFISMT